MFSCIITLHVSEKRLFSIVFIYSGVREDADGSVTYCLMGNGLTIMADEEYLTISSTLEPPHSFPSSLTTNSPSIKPTFPSSQTSISSSTFSSQNPNHVPLTTVSPLTLMSNTPTTCFPAPPSQPLTTQPSKAKHHPIQQGFFPNLYKAFSENSRPAVPPPPPPLPQLPAPPQTPITAQVISSVPPSVSPPARGPVTTFVLPSSGQSRSQSREEHVANDMERRKDSEEEEEEASRRKARLL